MRMKFYERTRRIAAYGLAFGLGTTQKMAALIPVDLEDNYRFSVSSYKVIEFSLHIYYEKLLLSILHS
jgi:hypothetical protein